MNLKAEVIEDTVTEYLDFIVNSFDENAPKELKEQARLLVGDEGDETGGFIAPLMSTNYNPNLFISGQMEESWNLTTSSNPYGIMGEHDTLGIEIMYSGLKYYSLYGDDDKVWWEFAEYNSNSETKKLARDYAFYQETGLDPIAKPKNARHKGAIAKGTKAASGELLNHSARYLKAIMRRQNGINSVF